MKHNKILSTLVMAFAFSSLAGCAATSTRESTGEYVSDAVITTKVKAALVNSPTVKATEVNVETYKGAVQLSGFVSSQAAVGEAVQLARAVQGVTSVKNDMRVK